MDSKYIYGIIKNSNNAMRDITGLGNSSQVYMVPYQDLSCVLSDYSGRDFGSMSKEEVVRCLLAHQVVVEHVMKEHTILPVKFGTILATSDEVCSLLSQGYSQFSNALAEIQDKVEIEVAATWDTVQVLREISAEREIVHAWEAIADEPEQKTLEERIRLGQMVKVLMDKRRDSYRERMINFLMSASVDVQPNVLISDEMVMNVAFLVEKANQDEFDGCVRQLDDLFHNQFNFRTIGPLPPYTFATVEVTRLSLEKIEEAKQLLRLGKVISEPEVRKAYRYLAAETHPDRKQGDELAKAQFAKLRQASDLLIAYCRGQAASNGSFLINIRRTKTYEETQHLRFAEISGVAGAANG